MPKQPPQLDASAYDVHQFATAMGLGPRKFMDAMRAGSLPMPLNPSAKAVSQFRWARGVVEAYIGGTFTGALLPPGVYKRTNSNLENAAAPATQHAPPRAPANVEPKGVPPEGRRVHSRPVETVDLTHLADESHVFLRMPDGSIKDLKLKN